MMKRVFLIVLDSFGIGAMEDAASYGDINVNTLRSVSSSPFFQMPHMEKLGLFQIDGVKENPMVQGSTGAGSGRQGEGHSGVIARMAERSRGKDTTIGHWEIAGIISPDPLPVYPDGFPKEVIKEFEEKTGRKVICNKPYSGTEVIKDYGREHMRTGALIVYTSADSVFQIAAHEDIIPVQELYKYCEIAREMLVGKHGVGRVIARPFNGKYPFTRTANRHDFSLLPPADTMLNLLRRAGYDTVSVGKIFDIFAGSGISESHRTTSNTHGMQVTKELQSKDFSGLCFVNLVDFDMKYGHRNDVAGYAAAATEFDGFLSKFIEDMKEEDVLLITADHGCDPATPSTDHSREYTPMLIYGNGVKSGVNLGTRSSFADISATVLEYFGVAQGGTKGESFLKEVLK